MARRGRFRKFRARASSSARRFGRRRLSSFSPWKIALGAALYGAVRETANNALAPLTSKIPLGQYADEAVLFGAGYLAHKKGSGLIKDLGMAAMIVEAASVGHNAAGGLVSGVTGGSSGGVAYFG